MNQSFQISCTNDPQPPFPRATAAVRGSSLQLTAAVNYHEAMAPLCWMPCRDADSLTFVFASSYSFFFTICLVLVISFFTSRSTLNKTHQSEPDHTRLTFMASFWFPTRGQIRTLIFMFVCVLLLCSVELECVWSVLVMFCVIHTKRNTLGGIYNTYLYVASRICTFSAFSVEFPSW